jgi:uncharacterized protein (DUF58 family)
MATELRDLFSSTFLARLEKLRLICSRRVPAGTAGSHRARKSGSSIDFADYRPYTPGDDPRAVDWNVYGRLDRLFIKQFEEEQDLDVSILVDQSGSMRWTSGGGSPAKLVLSLQLAATLAYLALHRLDRANVGFFGVTLQADTGFRRGKKAIHEILRFLAEVPPAEEGATRLEANFRAFSRRMKRRGLLVVLSDFLVPGESLARSLYALQGSGFSCLLLHIVDPAEFEPGKAGDLLLCNPETPEQRKVTVTPALAERYRRRVTAWKNELRNSALSSGCGYACLETGRPFEENALEALRQTPFVR